MTPSPSQHSWSHQALFAKAVLYVGRMESYTADDDQYALWSALSLEILARAALASISPVLLADGTSWRNIAYAVSLDPTAKKFTPVSISAKDVFSRLNELLEPFNSEVAGFCARHIDRRNAELHTGELAFAKVGTSDWLPKYYVACQVLLGLMDKELKDFFADPVTAQTMIDALGNEADKAVAQDIKAHEKVWGNKTPEEREQALLQATASSTRAAGHRVTCPSCKSPALLQGVGTGPVRTEINDDEVVQRQTMLPSILACLACGLRITGLSRLTASGLGDAFTDTSTYYASDFFGLYSEEDLNEARREGRQPEEDFNER